MTFAKNIKFSVIILFASIAILSNSCTEEEIPGCTNPQAVNYLAEATIDNGKCICPEKLQGAFVLCYTSMGSSYCGVQSRNFLYNLKSQETNNNIVIVNAHVDIYHDDLFNYNLVDQLSTNRRLYGGIPSYWVGDYYVYNRASDTLEYILEQDPILGVDGNYSITDNTLTLNTGIEFYNNANGNYYLTAFVLENGIPLSEHPQYHCSDSTFTHDFVLRTTNVPTRVYGEFIVENPVANSKFSNTYTINIDREQWKHDISVGLVVWEYTNGRPLFVNAKELKN